jgi:hypothetical protein
MRDPNFVHAANDIGPRRRTADRRICAPICLLAFNLNCVDVQEKCMPNKRGELLERSSYKNVRFLSDQPTEFRFRRAVGPPGGPLNSLSIEHNDLASGGANESFAFETVQRTGHAGSSDAQHQR